MAVKQPTARAPSLGIEGNPNAYGDPSANVLALVETANKRQDDLRVETNRRLDTEMRCIKEISEIRSLHAKEMAIAESKRLDANRQTDALAVTTASDRARVEVATLAATQGVERETSHALVTSTASSMAQQNANVAEGIYKRLAALEQRASEDLGKSRMADPQIAELLAEMKSVRESRAGAAGKSEGSVAMWGYIVAGAMLVVALLTVALRFGATPAASP